MNEETFLRKLAKFYGSAWISYGGIIINGHDCPITAVSSLYESPRGKLGSVWAWVLGQSPIVISMRRKKAGNFAETILGLSLPVAQRIISAADKEDGLNGRLYDRDLRQRMLKVLGLPLAEPWHFTPPGVRFRIVF